MRRREEAQAEERGRGRLKGGWTEAEEKGVLVA